MPHIKDDKNNKRKRDSGTQRDFDPIDIIRILTDDFDEDEFFEPINEEPVEDESKWPLEEIKREINDINDLIELGKMYDPLKKVRYNIDLKKLSKLVVPLEKLNNMIGLDSIKTNIVGHIVYHLANLENECNDMMHTVIQGPPGVGKTMLGRIMGDIYYNLGILKGSKKSSRSKRKRRRFKEDDYVFKIVKRSDLIGRYLGHTADKTQKVIDSCEGGVLFIDEAYSLGNPEGRDSFSKECIDTINQNLTEKKANFLCIIAGYKDSLEKCFFSYNEGLRRRFSFRYTIEAYTALELKKIFYRMVENIGWQIDKKGIPDSFFEDNYEHFTNMAGDMETLLFNAKIQHGKRVFCLPKLKKKLNKSDVKKALDIFLENRNIKKDKNDVWKYMYI